MGHQGGQAIVGEMEKGMGGINGDGRGPDFVLQNCTLETYIRLLINVTLINSIKRK